MSTRWSRHSGSPRGPATLDPLTSGLHGGPRWAGPSLGRCSGGRSSCATSPKHAPARLTADSRYVLWVNGQEVGRGPARSQPFRQRYDSYDLAPYLIAGDQRRRRPRDLLRPGHLVLAARSRRLQLGRGARVRGSPSERRSAIGRSSPTTTGGSSAPPHGRCWSVPRAREGVPVEIFDARQIPPWWREVDFDDSAWARAPSSAIHSAVSRETRPPTYPFGRLLPRGISHLGGDRVPPANVLDSSSRPAPSWTSDHPRPAWSRR